MKTIPIDLNMMFGGLAEEIPYVYGGTLYINGVPHHIEAVAVDNPGANCAELIAINSDKQAVIESLMVIDQENLQYMTTTVDGRECVIIVSPYSAS